ncbi:MAG: sensor domain-containing diguanylate cyclase [Terriglobales bacterium]
MSGGLVPGILCNLIGTDTCRKALAAPGVDFRALTEGSLDLICLVEVKDYRHRFIYVTPSALDVVGWSAEELLQCGPEKFVTEESMSVISGDIDKLLHGQPTSMVLVEAVRKDGDRIWLENKVRVLEKKSDGVMSVVVCMRDVTKRKLLEDRLARLALVDGLTGVDNRRAFDLGIDREWRRALRTGQPLSLILLDVDFFKRFNDAYGHQVGDDCLRSIAGTVRGAVTRAGDMVARYGGEEFAVLLPDTETAGAETLANEICRVVAALRIPHCGNQYTGGVVTVSCGISTALARLGHEPNAGRVAPRRRRRTLQGQEAGKKPRGHLPSARYRRHGADCRVIVSITIASAVPPDSEFHF